MIAKMRFAFLLVLSFCFMAFPSYAQLHRSYGETFQRNWTGPTISKGHDDGIPKSFGLEMSPLRLIATRNGFWFKGGVAFFDVHSGNEVLVQIALIDRGETLSGLFSEGGRFSERALDIQYRLNPNESPTGFQLIGVMRMSTQNNVESNSAYSCDDDYGCNDSETKTASGIGFGGGLGWLHITKSGFYWRISFVGGMYLDGNDEVAEGITRSGRIFVGGELFRFGVSF